MTSAHFRLSVVGRATHVACAGSPRPNHPHGRAAHGSRLTVRRRTGVASRAAHAADRAPLKVLHSCRDPVKPSDNICTARRAPATTAAVASSSSESFTAVGPQYYKHMGGAGGQSSKHASGRNFISTIPTVSRTELPFPRFPAQLNHFESLTDTRRQLIRRGSRSSRFLEVRDPPR